jgi:hypothetical protein
LREACDRHRGTRYRETTDTLKTSHARKVLAKLIIWRRTQALFGDEPMWDELKRPATTLWVIGIIISIMIALYFYKKGEKFGQIAIDVEQIQVFDKTRSGVVPLTVLDSAGRAIDNNVYATSVTIWNSGNSEVKKDDVREPIRLAVEVEGRTTPTRILDILPYFYRRNNMDGFSVSPNTAEISWQHFDAVEGLKVKIVYVSSTPKWVKLTGYAVGIEILDRQQLEEQRIMFNKFLVPSLVF